MPNGGTLLIGTANATLSEADGQEMFSVAAGPYVRLSVTDTGSGMTPDVLAKVFEPLFSTKSFGTGLGLPTVKQIVEQHGGEIVMESEVGRGSVFWFSLRRATAPTTPVIKLTFRTNRVFTTPYNANINLLTARPASEGPPAPRCTPRR